MKRLFVILLLYFVSACSGTSAPGGGRCKEGVCVDLKIEEPIRLNQPVRFTTTVATDHDEPGLKIFLGDTYPPVPVEGQFPVTLNARAHQPEQATGVIRFPNEGKYEIFVQAVTRSGVVIDNFLYVIITQAGATAYYPGTPLPITPGPAPTTPPDLRTRLAQPTPTRTSTPVPTP
jgi:hypothetical protein